MNECGASLQEIFVELGFMVSIGTAAGVNMASINTCALAGCSKPVWASSPGREEPHLTCGNLHHQLLMAGRFNPNMANTYSKILERNAEGFCALSSCEDPPFPDHSWCSRTHYLQWLFDFTSSFHEDQLCKVHGCTRHVFVEEDSTRSEFCGWRHYQKYAMSTAMPEQSRLPRLQEASGPLENPIEAALIGFCKMSKIRKQHYRV
ncbi:hypothetical protein KP509_18G043000 [Ceratopteris richardii]|uniref:Uncharacterized protein n=1 Tax=Ceratopteris richardii TaxID=49495 RepID=A0A8T2SSW5_CERRI|nr:hypothetical protein KP509_18G043000 [Ceratopteris richardii]